MSRMTTVTSAIAAVAVALVGAATMTQTPSEPSTLEAALTPTQVAVPPADVVLSCPPAILDQADDDLANLATGSSDVMSSGAFAERQSGAVSQVIDSEARTTAADGDALHEIRGATESQVVESPAQPATEGSWAIVANVPDAQPGDPSALPSGSVAHWADAGMARGLTTSACRPPAASHWLVAGDTEAGSVSSLVVSNPGLTTASVTVTLWGAGGQLEPLTSTSFAAAPGATQQLSLNAAVPDERRIVARVESTGGYVSATIHQTVVDGLVPHGVDDVAAGKAPDRVQVIPGVFVNGADIGSERTAMLRIMATKNDTTATVELLRADGKVILRGAQQVDLVDGHVTDVPLGGVPAGIYTIVVTADSPVVAGAKGVRDGGEITSSQGSVSVSLGTASDFAWVASALRDESEDEPAVLDMLVTIPPAVTAQLSVSRLPSDQADVVDGLAQIPVLGSGDAAANQDGAHEITITALSATGGTLGSATVSLGTVAAHVVRLNDLVTDAQPVEGQERIAAVRITSNDSLRSSEISVGLVTVVAEVSGSLGSMQPVIPVRQHSEVAVSRGAIR
ncbi:hypothetical protein SAMN06309944_2232 [Micrococcales bacterium KH10]|nr:hypothetical protein SAMN06309944_2232 [Micrococcales bacterium KH10]